MYVAEERRGRGRREKRQIVIERLFVDVRRNCRVLQDRLDLRREDETAILVIEVERLHADAIAHEDESLPVRVPEGDGVIAFELVNEVETAFFVEMENRFGVSARRIFVATMFQVRADERVVVDLAVEYEPGALVAAVHRLMTCGSEVNS